MSSTIASKRSAAPTVGPTDAFLPHATLALWVTAAVLGIGSLLDLGILWLPQREATPQWEFMAVSNTLNAIPTLVLSIGIGYLALALRRSESSALYRVLAGMLLLLGLVSGGMGAILMTDYFSLAGMIPPEAKAVLRSTTVKGLMLSVLFFLLMVPTGLIGVLRPRGRR